MLCPVCNAVIHEYVAVREKALRELNDWLRTGSGHEFEIACSRLNPDEPDRRLIFHRKHLDDIRAIGRL